MFSKPLPRFVIAKRQRRDWLLFQYPHSLPQAWLRDFKRAAWDGLHHCLWRKRRRREGRRAECSIR
jgi:hypothetical protein